MLGDVDRQQSARQWLALRPPQLPAIRGWDVAADDIVRPPKGTTHVVLDTPAGLHGKRLDAVLKIADRLLIPLQPSLFDIQATHAFVQALRAAPPRRRGALGLVGMRVQGTHAVQRAAAPVPGHAAGAGGGLAARHAELRAAGRARPDAVGRGAQPRRTRPRTMGNR
jgi:hypothetical protein